MRRAFHEEPRASVVKRRLVTVPRVVLLFVVVSFLMPVLMAAGIAVDAARWALTRRPWMSVRLIAFAWVYLTAEIVGLVGFFGTWVASGFGLNQRRLVATAWPLQRWWARTLFDAVQRLFHIDLDVTDLDVTAPGPIVAMFRHASIVDNLLPAVLLTDQQGYRLRWILKRELLAEPALDIAGTRLPNYFVDRRSADPRNEIRSIRRLAAGLGAGDGVLIYPEGTRFTPARRRRALQRLQERNPELHDRAEQLTNVLPPRIGGALTLLEAGYDVVVCAHEGLDGFSHIRDVWSGALVGKTVNVKFWRLPAEGIPRGRKERIDWLFTQWEHVDQWIGMKRQAPR
jgi:1-acyl-sn-glycerol-3-phosphate acyltransferase